MSLWRCAVPWPGAGRPRVRRWAPSGAPSGRGGFTFVAVYGAAGALVVAALVWTQRVGVRQPGVALAFGALVALGEAMRWDGRPAVRAGAGADRGAAGARGRPGEPEAGEREPAPVAAAAALGYAALGPPAGAPTTNGVLQTVAVVGAASLLALVMRAALGHPADLDRAARRVLTVAFVAICCQPLHHTGRLSSWFGRPGHGPCLVAALLLVLALAALGDAALAAALARAGTGRPCAPLLRDEPRALPGVGAAVCATAAVTAPAVAVAGLWVLPALCVPLLLVQYSFRRCAGIRATCRQTVASLARTTEIAGYTPAGHARQVAGLSRAVGRELRLSAPSLTVLEYAALMHDVGQLSLLDPVPAGATEPLPEAEQRRIALLGGAVVRQTGVPEEVAEIVERQADPYREQPLPARIVRAVNAYTELVGGSSGTSLGNPQKGRGAVGPGALERLRRGTARDFDPAVVEALATVVSRPEHDPEHDPAHDLVHDEVRGHPK
ncbi:HD-GYP domain-containing protein [Streptomyces sp. NPDC059679]|uniref:HD-GYP domain-containing protein n=1 Tax=Streptomyces sp. NPDC059679 TaxID=3346903 RepID=UPI0036C2BEDB